MKLTLCNLHTDCIKLFINKNYNCIFKTFDLKQVRLLAFYTRSKLTRLKNAISLALICLVLYFKKIILQKSFILYCIVLSN